MSALKPDAVNTHDLGTSGLPWKNLHVDTVDIAVRNSGADIPSGSQVNIGSSTKLAADRSVDVNIYGSLTVHGNTSTITSQDLVIQDKTITIANGSADSAAANQSGIEIDGAGAKILYAHNGTQWEINKPIEVSGSILPETTGKGDFDLGSATLPWNDLHLSSAGIVNFANGNVTLTHIAGEGLRLNGTSEIQFGDDATYMHQSADGQLDIISDATLKLTSPTAEIQSTTEVILDTPKVHLEDDGAILAFGADEDVKLTHVADQGLTLNDGMALRFRDADLRISSSLDGQLDIIANTKLMLTSPTAEIESSTEVILDTPKVHLEDDSVVLAFGADEDVTLTHVADQGLLLNNDLQLQFGDSGTYIHQSANGQLDIISDTTLKLTSPTSEIQSTTEVILDTPKVHLEDDGAILAFGADEDVTLTHVADQGLTLNDGMALRFRDAALRISSSLDGQLDIVADNELQITAPIVDIDASTRVDISGNALIGGKLDLTGNAILQGTLEVSGSTTIDDTLTVTSEASLDGGIDVNASNFKVATTGAIDTKSTLQVDGNVRIGENGIAGSPNLTIVEHAGGTTKFQVLGASGNTTVAGTLGVTGEATLASATISDLTDNRVLLAGTAGAVEDSANLTFNGSTLGVTGAATISSTLDVTGATTLGNSLAVTGATNIDSTLAVTGSTTLEDSLVVHGNTTIGASGEGTPNFRIQNNAEEVIFAVTGSNGDAQLSGSLTVGGDLIVNGTTTTVNSTTVTIDDPIFTLGGDTAPESDDNKDRGIEFRWHNSSEAKLGFFGYDDSGSHFTFIPDATNSNEIFTGTAGNVKFGDGEFTGVTSGEVTVGTSTNNEINTTAGNLILNSAGGTVNVQDNVDIDETLNVDGATSLKNTLAVTGATNIDSTLEVTGSTTLKNQLDLTGAAYLQSTLNVSGSTTVDDTLTVTGEATLASATISDLTENRIVLAGANGVIEDDSKLTFNGTTLALNGAATVSSTLSAGATTLSSAKISDLTSGRVVLAGTAGEIEDSANLLFDGSRLHVTGSAGVTGAFNADGATTLGDTLGVTGATTLSNTLGVTGVLTATNRILVNDETEATTTGDGSLRTAGGLSVAKSSVIGDDLSLLSDAAILNFGANEDVRLTHVHNTGLLLSGSGGDVGASRQLQFGDSGTYIHQSTDGQLDVISDTTLKLTSPTAEIESSTEVLLDTPKVHLEDDSAALVFGAGEDVTLTHDGSTGIDAVSAGAFDIQAGAESTIETTAGTLILSGASGIKLEGNAGEVDITTTGAFDINSGATTIDCSTLTITQSGALSIDSAASLTLSGSAITLHADGSGGNGAIVLDTDDTTGGIKLGTDSSGVPVSIGHTTSETTVNDNITVIGTSTFESSTTIGKNGNAANFSVLKSNGDPAFEVDIDGGGNTIIYGNLTVTSALASNGSSLDVVDPLIKLNKNVRTSDDFGWYAPLAGANENVAMVYDVSDSVFKMYTSLNDPTSETFNFGTGDAGTLEIGQIYLNDSAEGSDNVATPLTTHATYYNTGASGETSTLAAATNSEGQIKVLAMESHGGGDMVVTVSNPAWTGSGTITLSAQGQACTLQYIDSKWYCIGNNGCAFG